MGEFLSYWNGSALQEQSRFAQVGLPFADESTIRTIVDEMLYYTPTFGLDSEILEVGCGNGLFLEELQQRGFQNLTGVDYSEEMIVKAQQYCHDINFECLAAHLLSSKFKTSSFDLIYLHSVTQYFEDHSYFGEFLDSCLDVMKDNGCLYIGDVFNRYIHEYNKFLSAQRWKGRLRKFFGQSSVKGNESFYLDLNYLLKHEITKRGLKVYPLLEWINSKPLDFKAFRYNLLIKKGDSL